MIRRTPKPPTVLESLLAKRRSAPSILEVKPTDYSSQIRNLQDSLLTVSVEVGNLSSEIDRTKNAVSSLPTPEKPLNYDIELLTLKNDIQGLERSVSKLAGSKDFDKKIEEVYKEINRVIGAINALPARRNTGTIRFKPNIGGWNDYEIDALALDISHATAPSRATFIGNLSGLAFIGTGVNIKDVECSIHIKHDYKFGTAVYPHVHWSHIIASPTGNVKWGIEYSVSKGHSKGTFPPTTTVYVTQAAGAQYTHQIVEVSDADVIPATNLEPDSVIKLRIFRDPADAEDTFENDAYLMFVDIHYQSDGVYTVEKVSPFTKVSQ